MGFSTSFSVESYCSVNISLFTLTAHFASSPIKNWWTRSLTEVSFLFFLYRICTDLITTIPYMDYSFILFTVFLTVFVWVWKCECNVYRITVTPVTCQPWSSTMPRRTATIRPSTFKTFGCTLSTHQRATIVVAAISRRTTPTTGTWPLKRRLENSIDGCQLPTTECRALTTIDKNISCDFRR